MKATFIALSAAALIAAAPASFARNASSKTPDLQHQISKKHIRTTSTYTSRHATHAKNLKAGYPAAFSYSPSEAKDWELESSRHAGGGGSGM